MNKNIASKKKCYLCSSENIKLTEYKVRDNEDLQVLKCQNCSLSFLSSFDHINNKFYKEGQMHNFFGNFNINNWLESSYQDDLRRFKFLKDRIKNKRLLDFGCGAGGFLKFAKNISDAYGIEEQESLKEYFLKENINVKENILELKNTEKFHIITLFHVLEHFKDPENELKTLCKYLRKDGEIIIEVPSSNDALLKLYKNKAFGNFTHWSCHLFCFNQNTLIKIADKLNLKVNYIKNLQRYSLMNHLYWIIKNRPGGHKVWKKFDFKFINFIYKTFLTSLNLNDTIIISLSQK